MTIEQDSGHRLKLILDEFYPTQVSATQTLDVSQGYLSQMVNGDKPISRNVLQKLAKSHPDVNIDWLLTGEGSMRKGALLKNYKVDEYDLVIVNDPQMNDVDKLFKDTLDRYKPETALTLKQSFALKQACYKVMIDNPGQSWGAWIVGAGVYLRYIISFPDSPLPD